MVRRSASSAVRFPVRTHFPDLDLSRVSDVAAKQLFFPMDRLFDDVAVFGVEFGQFDLHFSTLFADCLLA